MKELKSLQPSTFFSAFCTSSQMSQITYRILKASKKRVLFLELGFPVLTELVNSSIIPANDHANSHCARRMSDSQSAVAVY